jgi:glycopeptide antibiotics resistance protein
LVLYRHRFKFHATWHRKIHKRVAFRVWYRYILVLTYIALFMNKFKEKIDWTPAKKDITFLCIIWFAYSLFEIINPEARSIQAWISGRGIAFYPLLFIP